MSKSVEQNTQRVLRGKDDFLSMGELSPMEFKTLLDLADLFKKERESKKLTHQMPGTSLALLFEKPSTRTRVSFEVAMFELGGHAVVLNQRDMQISRGESIEDTARVLSRFCHGIAARVYSHETLVRFAKSASIPVINALSDLYHPCQTIADLQTIRESKRKLRGLKIAWIGDGNNVCNSLLIGASLVGMDMSVGCPKGYTPLEEALTIAKKHSENGTRSKIVVTNDVREAASGADVVVTDTFVSMGQDAEKEARLKTFLPEYRVNKELMSFAKEDAIFLHCLPAHRGEEVTSEVIDGPRSMIWNEAENRLHGQKAILYTLMKRFSMKS